MAYFPFFVDIEGQKCLIVGGGIVAYRKVLALREYGPVFVVVAPSMCEEMEGYALGHSAAELVHRGFEDRDLDGVNFVVVATDEEDVNRRVSYLCKERHIPVNVVDVKEECSFIFPAIVREGDITVGISTGGSSPAIAQMVKARVKEAIPEGFGRLAAQLGTYRALVKEKIHDQKTRAGVFSAMAETGVKNGGYLDETEARQLIEKGMKDE